MGMTLKFLRDQTMVFTGATRGNGRVIVEEAVQRSSAAKVGKATLGTTL
jgi:hypothetical protein